MSKSILILAILLVTSISRADFFGGDLPLLMEIVTNTLNTMQELQRQSTYMDDELSGIKDKIYRVQSIAELVQPSSWDQWRDPKVALSRLRTIYGNLPTEYRSEKYELIDDELSKAMNMIARMNRSSSSSFASGKELESRGLSSSPGVAEKLTASGVGTLVALQSQTQVIESHVTSLLAQILADANEKETRAVATKGTSLRSISSNLGSGALHFSQVALFGEGRK